MGIKWGVVVWSFARVWPNQEGRTCCKGPFISKSHTAEALFGFLERLESAGFIFLGGFLRFPRRKCIKNNLKKWFFRKILRWKKSLFFPQKSQKTNTKKWFSELFSAAPRRNVSQQKNWKNWKNHFFVFFGIHFTVFYRHSGLRPAWAADSGL